MDKQFEKRPVVLDGKKYLVPTYFYGENNAKHKLVLSPGFSLPGKYFEKFSNLLNLYMKYSGGIQIIIPEIIGKKIKSIDDEIYKNNTHEKNKILYNNFLNELNLDKEPVESFQSYCAQSSGPINFKSKKIILINPLVEVDYNRYGFILRALNASITKEPNLAIFSKFGFDFLKQFFNNFSNNFSCLDYLTKLTNDEIYPTNKNSDVLLIAAVNKKLKDQYFNYKGIEEKIGYKYDSFEFVPIFGGTHHSIIYEPLRFILPIRERILK